MSVLNDLVDDAASDQVPTIVLLRRMKVLAIRLKTPPLAQWVQNELEGYGRDEELPGYRGPFTIDPRGHFNGYFQSEITDGKMPSLLIDESVRSAFDQFYAVELRQGLATLEGMRGTDVGLHWPSDAIAYVNTLIGSGKIKWYADMFLASALTPVPEQVILSAVDAVRTRLLDLALGIEAEDPSAGDPGSASIAPEKVTTIYNTVVHGGNVALGSSDFAQITDTVPSSVEDLIERLHGLGLPEDLTSELAVAIEADGPVTDELGDEVQGWLSKTIVWAGRQASSTGTGALGGVVAQVVLMFLGLVPGT